MTEPRNAEFYSEYELQPKKRWWRRVRDTVTGRSETTVPEAAVKPEFPPWTGVR